MSTKNETNPVKEMMEGSYFYETTSVGRTRKNKSCSICSATIPSGSAHNGAKAFHGEFYQLDFCSECEDKYSNELAEMKQGKYDSY